MVIASLSWITMMMAALDQPQDRDECYCASCFYGGRPMFCGCGKPSYDPFDDKKDEENEEETQEEEHNVMGGFLSKILCG